IGLRPLYVAEQGFHHVIAPVYVVDYGKREIRLIRTAGGETQGLPAVYLGGGYLPILYLGADMAGDFLGIYPVAVPDSWFQAAEDHLVEFGYVLEAVAGSVEPGPFPLVEMAAVVGRQFHPGDGVLVRGPDDGHARIMQCLQIRSVGDGK